IGGNQISQQLQSAARDFFDSIKDELADAFPLAGVNVRTGEMEFQDFVGLLYHSRGNGYTSTDRQGSPISAAFAGKQFNFSEYGLVFHDYARRRHVEVILQKEGFSISRGVE